MAGGNDEEDLANNPYLKSIIEGSAFYNEELLIIAGGFDYLDEVFDREDIIYANSSARVASEDFNLRRVMLTGPYKVKVYQYESIEDRKKKLLEYRKHLDAEEFRRIWIEDLFAFLDRLRLSEIEEKDRELIKRKLSAFAQLFKRNHELSFSLGDCQSFIELSKRDDFPIPLRKELEKFGRNFLSLSIDLLTTDPAKASEVPPEERQRLEKLRNSGYNLAKANGDFERAIMVFGKDQRPAEHVFSLKTTRGTSFSSPALMSVFLLLNEHNEREGNHLTAEDILRCMRASAWQKPYADKAEDLAWYGAGVIDGGKALELCQLLIKARKQSLQSQFMESLNAWKALMQTLKGHAKGNYILEIAHVFKSSSAYQEIHLSKQEKALAEFYRELLSLWPALYPNHLEDRLEAFMSFERNKPIWPILSKIREAIPSRETLVEMATLIPYANERERFVYRSFITAYRRFESWLDSFIESELKFFKSHKGPYGELFLEESLVRPNKADLPLDIREGYAIVTHLTKEIRNTWEDFEKLNLKDTIDSMDREMFLDTILALPEKLKSFSLPGDLSDQLKRHIERAKVAKRLKCAS